MRRPVFALGGAVVLTLGVLTTTGQGQAPKPSTTKPAATSAAKPAAPVASHAAATGMTAEAQTQLVKQVLHGLPQRSQQGAGGESHARRVRCRDGRRSRRRRREDDSQAPRRHDAAAGAKRPDEATLTALATALETRIDRSATLNPNPGHRPFQRLNRAEYAAPFTTCSRIDIDVSALLPPDTISHGFDNIADVQAFSPTVLEGYLRAAAKVSRDALGDPTGVTDLADLQGAANRGAAAPRGRCAGRHARRRLGHAHLPGRRRIHVPDDVPQHSDRSALRQHDARRADRDLDQRPAHGAPRHQPAHERVGSEGHQPRDRPRSS